MVQGTKEPRIISYYQQPCLGVKPQKVIGNSHQKRHIKLKIGRTKSERQRLCVAVLANAPIYPLPKKCIAESFQDFTTAFRDCLIDVNKKIKQANPKAPPVKSVTSEELFRFISTSTDPKIQQIAAKFSEDEIRMMSKSWLQISDSPRFLAKQLSSWASNNSAAHLSFLNAIFFTVSRLFRWLPRLFYQRPFSTIQTFSLGPYNQFLRITYELAIPLENPNSPACKSGKAGSNAFFPNNDFVTYCLLIEYEKDPNSDAFLKVGKPVTGFIRETKYNFRMLSCLENPSPSSLPWGGLLGLISNYQQVIINHPLKLPIMVKTTILTLIAPVTQMQQSIKTKFLTGLIKRLTVKHFGYLLQNQAYTNKILQKFSRLSTAFCYLHNKFMRNEYK